MDPLSIAAASLSVVKLCGVVGLELTKFIQDSDLVGPTVAGLHAEVKSFEVVLGLLNDTLNDKNVRAWVTASGKIGTYWHSLELSLGDARGTLESLEETVTRITKPAKVLESTRKQIRLQMAGDEISIYRQQIGRFKDTVQVILNTTTIWHQASDKEVSETVIPRLDETQQMIRQLGKQFNEQISLLKDQMKQTSANEDDEKEYQALDNLRNCLKGAASVITSASEAMGRKTTGGGSTVYGSDFGDVFPVAPSDLTLNWIEDNTITESDEGYATRSEVSRGLPQQEYEPLEPISEPEFDAELELEMMQACYRRGLKYFAEDKLEEAERFLRNCVDGLLKDDDAVIHVQQAPFMIDALASLGTILKRQEKWSDLQSLMKSKMHLQSRTPAEDETVQLADKLLLSEALIMCEEYKEALLYCRSAEVAYRKLGASGIDGRIQALTLICRIQENTGRQREAERCHALIEYLSDSNNDQDSANSTQRPDTEAAKTSNHPSRRNDQSSATSPQKEDIAAAKAYTRQTTQNNGGYSYGQLVATPPARPSALPRPLPPVSSTSRNNWIEKMLGDAARARADSTSDASASNENEGNTVTETKPKVQEHEVQEREVQPRREQLRAKRNEGGQRQSITQEQPMLAGKGQPATIKQRRVEDQDNPAPVEVKASRGIKAREGEDLLGRAGIVALSPDMETSFRVDRESSRVAAGRAATSDEAEPSFGNRRRRRWQDRIIDDFKKNVKKEWERA